MHVVACKYLYQICLRGKALNPEQVHRGEDWVNKYIHGFVSLATPFLGVPKGVAALLSGEAKVHSRTPIPRP